MEKHTKPSIVDYCFSILRMIQFIVNRYRIIWRLLAIILISALVIFLFIYEFYSNIQIYYLYKDHSNCSFELYAIQKVLKIINWGYLLFFLANMITWFEIDEIDQERNKLLPIDFKIYTYSVFIVSLIFYLIVGILFLGKFFIEWDYFLTGIDLIKIPFNKSQIYQSFFLNSIYWSILSLIIILVKKYMSRSNKILYVITMLFALWVSNYLAPINIVIKELSKYC
jgi:hypothetical protein